MASVGFSPPHPPSPDPSVLRPRLHATHVSTLFLPRVQNWIAGHHHVTLHTSLPRSNLTIIWCHVLLVCHELEDLRTLPTFPNLNPFFSQPMVPCHLVAAPSSSSMWHPVSVTEISGGHIRPLFIHLSNPRRCSHLPFPPVEIDFLGTSNTGLLVDCLHVVGIKSCLARG